MYQAKFTEEAYQLIGKIVNRTEVISRYQGKIPAIEIDLALEDIRKLYDCYLVMKAIGEEPVKVAEPVDALTVEEAAKLPEISMEEEEPVAVEVTPGEEPVAQEPILTVDQEAPVSKEALVAPPEEEAAKSQKKILADKLKQGEPKSINDLIAARRADTSISSRMQHNPIRDLKSAIGINEKFIFVYELFGGNVQLYSQEIDRLNSMPGRDEAIGLMESLRHEYHWEIENMAFQKLVDMVSRRYS